MFYELSKREIFPELSLGGFSVPLRLCSEEERFLFILQRQVQTLILISGQTPQNSCAVLIHCIKYYA